MKTKTATLRNEAVAVIILIGIICCVLAAGLFMGAWMHAKIICTC
jgi:hypothetical protein